MYAQGTAQASAAGAEDGKVYLWDSLTGEQLAALEGHSKIVWAVAFHPDGTALASGGEDNTIIIWR